MRSGSKPTFSMMSTSPHIGHPTCARLAPSIQIAGQVPVPFGSFARTSTRPYVNSNFPSVLMLPDV